MYNYVVMLAFLGLSLYAQAERVTIVTHGHLYTQYQCLVANRTVVEIEDYSGPCSSRNTVEVILIQQMLALGGFEYEFKLEPGYYNQKERRLLRSGLLLISVDSVWQNEAQEMAQDVYISAPIIEAGNYLAGLYAIASNKSVFKVNDVEQLKKMRVVSSQNWSVDWQVLQQAGFKEIVNEPVWNAHVNALERGLADLMMLPFSNRQDKGYYFQGNWYMPVANFYMRLPESRHIIISKKHHLGEAAYRALAKGMAIMKANGTIEKAYRQSGLFLSDLENWQQINP